jgi:hypothetical protein
MKLETKYEIGQHIWAVYKNEGTVEVYDDYIGWISYEDKLIYGLKESCNDLEEQEIVLYEDKEGLANRIKEVMEEIRKNEKNV